MYPKTEELSPDSIKRPFVGLIGGCRVSFEDEADGKEILVTAKACKADG